MDGETTAQVAPDTDSVLLGRYADSGDMDAFAALVRRHTQAVYGVCVRRLWNNRDLAQDAAQMVFVLLARQAGRLRKRSEVGSWLYKAAVFTAMRIRAKEDRREAIMSKYADNVSAGDGNESSSFLDRAGSVLDVAVARLSEKYRQVLVMHYFQGLSYDQIAAGTGNPVGTVRTHLDRARDRLREEMTKFNLALTGPMLLQILQNESIIQVPAGLVEKCVGAVTPGGGAGNISDHDAILKDMHSAESRGAGAKLALGACAAGVIAVAAVVVSHREDWNSVPAPAVLPAIVSSAESDVLFQDDFQDGMAQWEVVEQAPGKQQFTVAGASAKELVETRKQNGNDVLAISAPRKSAKDSDNIAALGIRLRQRLPSSGYVAQWDERREDVGAIASSTAVSASNYVLRSEVTNIAVRVGKWTQRRLVCTPAGNKDGLPCWRLDSYLDKTLVFSSDLSYDTSILQIEAMNGRIAIDNVVVRRLPKGE